MSEREFIQKRFLPPQPPDALIVNTGQEDKFEEQTEIFFRETADYLGLTPAHLEVGYAGLTVYCFAGITVYCLAEPGANDNLPTDNYIRMLQVGEYPVASVMTIRDPKNWVIAIWSSHLTEKTEAYVRSHLPQSKENPKE
jgi:hypothetical protein